MKPRKPSHPDRRPSGKVVHQEKPPGCSKVWVNPKAQFKNFSHQAWSEAEVPSPKFIDISDIDLRTMKPCERPKPKAAAGKSRGSSKSPKAGR
jgi:hypothetical protein